MPNPTRRFVFGRFQFEVPGLSLTKDGVELPLPARAGRLLWVLLEHAGAVVGNQQLLDQAWDDAVVEEANVSQQVYVIKSTLGPRPTGGHYVENLRGRGYRFVGLDGVVDHEPTLPRLPAQPVPVTNGIGSVEPTDHPLPAPSRPRVGWPALTAAALGLAVVGVLAFSWTDRSRPPLRLGEPRQLTRDGLNKGIFPLLADDQRVIYRGGWMDHITVLPLDGGESHPLFEAPAHFVLEDLHAQRQEYLARKLPAPDGVVDLPLWIIPTSPGAPRRVAAVEARSAVWSPDGRQLAVVRDGGLEIMNADGTVVRRLVTPRDSLPQWLRWSPDGERIRFTSASVISREGYRETLWEIHRDGSGLQLLPFSGEAGRADCCGTWTPDGGWFVYQSRFAGRTQLRAVATGENVAIDLTGGEMNFGGPAVSPDGNTLYAVGWPTIGELVTFDSSRRAYIIEPSGISGTWITYSPNRDAMAYVRYPDKTLWRARVDGTRKQQLVNGPFEIDACTWSPDNRFIAFRSRMGGTALRIYLVPVEGGVPKPISDDDRAQGIPSWSPDGRSLLFGDVPGQFGRPDGGERLWIHHVDTSETTELAGTQHLGLYAPHWSPDGASIAAVEIQHPRRIRLYDVRTKTWRVLTSTSRVDDMQWTRDGKALIYRTEGNMPALKRFDLADGRVTDLVDLRLFTFAPEAYGWHGLSLDDMPMLLRNRGATEIYAFPLVR